MATDDNDMIDAAMERAEARMAAEAEEKPIADIPAELPHEENETPVTDEESDAERIEGGEVSPTEENEEQISEGQSLKSEELEADKEKVDGEESSVEPPADVARYWPSAMKRVYARSTGEERQAMLDYEAQRNEFVHSKLSESQNDRAIKNEIYGAYEPLKEAMLERGVDPVKLAKRGADWMQLEIMNPVQACHAYLRSHGFSVLDLPDEGAEATQNSNHQSPEVAELRTEIQSLRSERENEQKAVLQREAATVAYERTPDGQLMRPYFDKLKPLMKDAVLGISQRYPQMPPREVYRHAYDFTVKELGLAQEVLKEKPKPSKEQIIAASKKIKAARSSISGAPISDGTSRPKAKNFNEALDRALDTAMERVNV